MSKSQRGQFYTTNYEYILSNIKIPDGITHIIEPFVGQGDLLKFIGNDYHIEKYDIDPKIEAITRDTLMDPPDYKDKYVITNPPYLARNKSIDKTIFDKYNSNDLYRCFIISLLINPPVGGILIIPVSFWTSTSTSNVELRKRFLNVMTIVHMNIFEEKVFDDTGYSVCAFSFVLGKNSNTIPIRFYPENKHSEYVITNGTIGGEMFELPQTSDIKIERITRYNKDHKNCTNITIKCIDDSEDSRICAKITDEPYVDNTKNLSARSYMSLIITPNIDEERQKKLVSKFNSFIERKRDKYNSLFLTTYREGSRKRISFQMVYEILNYRLSKIL